MYKRQFIFFAILLVATQIRGHVAVASPPFPPTVRALHFYCEKASVLSSLVDSRRLVLKGLKGKDYRDREPSANNPWFVVRENQSCWFVPYSGRVYKNVPSSQELALLDRVSGSIFVRGCFRQTTWN